MGARRKIKIKPRKWDEYEDNFLRKYYPNCSTESIARRLSRSACSVFNRARKIGLSKSAEFLASFGYRLSSCASSQATRFKPGHTPENKGKRLADYISKEGLERSKATRFKPGAIPYNKKPVGSEIINCDGHILVKVEDHGKWMLKRNMVWIQHYGDIPKNMVVCFKDGNKLNCDISNLVLLSRSEIARREIARLSPEQRQERYQKAAEARRELIRKDKMRIRWGLEPKTKLVKKWYDPKI